MEAKLESLTISESAQHTPVSSDGKEEENIAACVEDNGKKMELNVNAKEFVPRFTSEASSLTSEAEETDHRPSAAKTSLNGKIGDENYKPIFMNGMTEKFIGGPYMGNGRDTEIPYMRYYANGQAMDFFNKKYFGNNSTGEILFKPYETNEENRESYSGPLFANGFCDNNIFKPPFINALMSDILYRQYISAMWPKSSPFLIPPRRGGGKGQYSNGLPNGNQRPPTTGGARIPRNDKWTPKFSSSNEEWLADEACAPEGPYGQPTENIPDSTVSSPKTQDLNGSLKLTENNHTGKGLVTNETQNGVKDLEELPKTVAKDEPLNASQKAPPLMFARLPKREMWPPKRPSSDEVWLIDEVCAPKKPHEQSTGSIPDSSNSPVKELVLNSKEQVDKNHAGDILVTIETPSIVENGQNDVEESSECKAKDETPDHVPNGKPAVQISNSTISEQLSSKEEEILKNTDIEVNTHKDQSNEKQYPISISTARKETLDPDEKEDNNMPKSNINHSEFLSPTSSHAEFREMMNPVMDERKEVLLS